MLMRMQVVVVLMNTRQVYDAGVRKKLPARQTQLHASANIKTFTNYLLLSSKSRHKLILQKREKNQCVINSCSDELILEKTKYHFK